MDQTERIPNQPCRQGDRLRLERAATEAVLCATEGGRYDQRALAGIATDRSPREAAARMRAARAGHQLPPGVSIRDLMTYGRA